MHDTEPSLTGLVTMINPSFTDLPQSPRGVAVAGEENGCYGNIQLYTSSDKGAGGLQHNFSQACNIRCDGLKSRYKPGRVLI